MQKCVYPASRNNMIERILVWRRRPKLYDLELERRVREQMTIVAELINDALLICRASKTRLLAPDLSGQIGHAGLEFELVGMPIDGLVNVSYTGPQAHTYLEILKKGLDQDRQRNLACVAKVWEIRFNRGTRDREPSITAQLQLPINIVG